MPPKLGKMHTASIGASDTLDLYEPADHAIAPWWSFTKTLIAICTLRLVEQGALTLDARLSGQPYTLRHLLQHRAGLGDYTGLSDYWDAVTRGDGPWPDEEVLKRTDADRLLFDPGTGWRYSNVGYLILRRLIEETEGADLDALLRSYVFTPMEAEHCRVARALDDMRQTAFEGGHDYHPDWVYHGLVIGPADCAVRILHRLMTGRLLKPNTLAAMLDRHPVNVPLPEDRPWVTTGYGLGLMIGTARCDGHERPLPFIGHSANGPGSSGAVYHCPDTQRTAAAFTNDENEAVPETEVVRRVTKGRR